MKTKKGILISILLLILTYSPLTASKVSQEEVNTFNAYVCSKNFEAFSSRARHRSFVGRKLLESGAAEVTAFAPGITAKAIFPSPRLIKVELLGADEENKGDPQSICVFQEDPINSFTPKLGFGVINTRTGTKQGIERILKEVKQASKIRDVKNHGPYTVVIFGGRKTDLKVAVPFIESLEIIATLTKELTTERIQ